MSATEHISTRGNDILAALPDADLTFLTPHLKWIELQEGQVLHEEGDMRISSISWFVVSWR